MGAADVCNGLGPLAHFPIAWFDRGSSSGHKQSDPSRVTTSAISKPFLAPGAYTIKRMQLLQTAGKKHHVSLWFRSRHRPVGGDGRSGGLVGRRPIR